MSHLEQKPTSLKSGTIADNRPRQAENPKGGEIMTLVSTKKASKFFEAKVEFTTGPFELNHMIETGENLNIIDVREPEDYQKGHIPRAVNLPKERWDTFCGLSRTKVNIVYCYSEVCHLAATAAWQFADHGFPVMELEGGFDTWKQYNLPIES
jgi:rhodanese-related sulfurtransferase